MTQERVEVAGVPRRVTARPGVEFGDGDRIGVMHATRPGSGERHYLRHNQAWNALDGTEPPFDDARMRELMAEDPRSVICRHDPAARAPATRRRHRCGRRHAARR